MKTLLILHGWQSSKEKWQEVKEEIEKTGVKVICPDLPGFKPENELREPWNLDKYENWLEKFIAEQNLPGEFYLLGYSFGAGVAVKYVLKNPGRVGKLFLVSAACVRSKTLGKEFMEKASKIFNIFSFLPFYPLFRKAAYKYIIRRSDYPQTEGVLRQTFLNIIKEDLSPVLAGIKIPTVLIWGDKDVATPLKDGQFINQQIKNSKMEIVPGAGHIIYSKHSQELAGKIISNL